MIRVLKYGSGNVQAILNIYKRLNIQCEVATTASEVNDADKLILPGVGAFDESLELFNDSGMREAVDNAVLQEKRPILGVCVGMQVMATSSEEGGSKGLNWIPGRVKRFDESNLHSKPKLPHMGWNDVRLIDHEIFRNIDKEMGFYFLHSFYFECEDPDHVIAEADYGGPYACAINRENVFGFQFHPEKSHQNGVNLFKNFASL